MCVLCCLFCLDIDCVLISMLFVLLCFHVYALFRYYFHVLLLWCCFISGVFVCFVYRFVLFVFVFVFLCFFCMCV